MSDRNTVNKNDRKKPSASNIKSPKPKKPHAIRLLAVPGSGRRMHPGERSERVYEEKGMPSPFL